MFNSWVAVCREIAMGFECFWLLGVVLPHILLFSEAVSYSETLDCCSIQKSGFASGHLQYGSDGVNSEEGVLVSTIQWFG
jgi:hypothetical protein